MTPDRWRKQQEARSLQNVTGNKPVTALVETRPVEGERPSVAGVGNLARSAINKARSNREREEAHYRTRLVTMDRTEILEFIEEQKTYGCRSYCHTADELLRWGVEELHRRYVREFIAQHDCVPEAEWDDELRFLFDVSYPEART